MPVLDSPKIRYNRSMTEQEIVTLMQPWGYYLEPKAHAFSPGYAGIFVAIRARPTHQHYDPEMIELCLLNQGSVERVQLRLQTRTVPIWRVYPGRLTLQDRYHKRTDFYTYGAKLSTISGQGETIYRFASNAPILWLAEDGTTFPEQLEAETEAILAGIHSQWSGQDSRFARRLVEIEPIDLYLATLRSISDRYARAPALKENFHSFHDSLQREILWQQTMGYFRADGPHLETLLIPDTIA
jgi:hypothetical protein